MLSDNQFLFQVHVNRDEFLPAPTLRHYSFLLLLLLLFFFFFSILEQTPTKFAAFSLMFMRTIDPYHSAATLSLGGINSFVFARQDSARREFSARLAVQKQSFLFSGDSL